MPLTQTERDRVRYHQVKVCRACQIEKPLEDFHRHKSGMLGRDSICKPCHKAKTYAWREKNPGGHARVQAAYRSRNPEKVRASMRKWYSLHGAEREAGRPARRWADPRQRALILAARKNRYGRMRAGRGDVTNADVQTLLKKPCAYCGGAATEVDHVVPLSRGGKHELANLAPACRSCNARKNTKTPDEWRARCP